MTITTQETVSLVDFVTKFKEELKLYQDCDGKITTENQVVCFHDVARIDFRLQTQAELPPALRDFYEGQIRARNTKDYHYDILVRQLDHLVKVGGGSKVR